MFETSGGACLFAALTIILVKEATGWVELRGAKEKAKSKGEKNRWFLCVLVSCKMAFFRYSASHNTAHRGLIYTHMIKISK